MTNAHRAAHKVNGLPIVQSTKSRANRLTEIALVPTMRNANAALNKYAEREIIAINIFV